MIKLDHDHATWVRRADLPYIISATSTSNISSAQQHHASTRNKLRPISSGHGMPRTSAWHLAQSTAQNNKNIIREKKQRSVTKNNDWQPDTLQQFCDHLLDTHSNVELASIHPYVHIKHGTLLHPHLSLSSCTSSLSLSFALLMLVTIILSTIKYNMISSSPLHRCQWHH